MTSHVTSGNEALIDFAAEGRRWRAGPPSMPYTTPESYKAGAPAAKQRAIELYRQYFSRLTAPDPDSRTRINDLQNNPKGTNKLDYFWAKFED
jgi:hypothetical protein